MTTTLDKNPLYMTGLAAEQAATDPTKVRMGTWFGVIDTVPRQFWRIEPTGPGGVHAWVKSTGATGPAGAPGAAGTGGGYIEYATFYQTTPHANYGLGVDLTFPTPGPASGSILPFGVSFDQFILTNAGTYEVAWEASINEPAQLALFLSLGGVQLQTLSGRATPTSLLVNNVFITTAGPGVILSLRNAGTIGAVTLTPIAGGGSQVNAWLSIKRVA